MTFWYVRIEDDGEGTSRFVDVTLAAKEVLVSGTPGGVLVSDPIQVRNVTFAELSRTGGGDEWHNAPRLQFAVVLSGRIEVETSDGEIRECGPGDVLMGADVRGKGHRFRVVEGRPHVMFIPLREQGSVRAD